MANGVTVAPFSYIIQYRPDQRNVGPDTFTRAYCFAVTMTSSTLQDVHDVLRHRGATRLLYFVRCKNLPFSTTDVVRITVFYSYILFVVRFYRFLSFYKTYYFYL